MKYFFTLILLYFYNQNSFTEEFINPYKIEIKQFKATKIENLKKGNIEEGKLIVSGRKANCLSCHQAPIPEEKFQGNFGPSLVGIGSTYTREEIRLRIINAKILNPNSIMPSYFIKIEHPRTPSEIVGKTILTVKEVEDIVEYLYSLK